MKAPWLGAGDAVRLLAERAACEPAVAWEVLKGKFESGQCEGRERWTADTRWREDRGLPRKNEWSSVRGIDADGDAALARLNELWEFRRDAVDVLARAGGGADASAAASTPAMPARPRNIARRDYEVADAPLVQEMRKMIDAGTARNPTDAARALVGRAEGGGSAVSKAARLAKRYRAAI